MTFMARFGCHKRHPLHRREPSLPQPSSVTSEGTQLATTAFRYIGGRWLVVLVCPWRAFALTFGSAFGVGSRQVSVDAGGGRSSARFPSLSSSGANCRRYPSVMSRCRKCFSTRQYTTPIKIQQQPTTSATSFTDTMMARQMTVPSAGNTRWRSTDLMP